MTVAMPDTYVCTCCGRRGVDCTQPDPDDQPRPKRRAQDLELGELTMIVELIQELLWCENPDEAEPQWNPDREWDSSADFLENIAGLLESYGLKPVEKP